MSREINIDELLEGIDDLEGVEFIESLMGVYDYGYEKLSNRMDSGKMMAYQDYMYDGKTNGWD